MRTLQAQSTNVVGYDDQTMPYQYAIMPVSETTVIWSIQIQGTWTINFNYAVRAQAIDSALKSYNQQSWGSS